MVLSRLKGSLHLQAIRRFTNRETAVKAFNDATAAVQATPDTFRVLSFYGVGGIGKSRLLRHFHNKSETIANSRIVSIDLEAPTYGSQVDYLLDLRAQLGVSAVLFDYALTRFLTVNGRSLKEIDRRFVPADSLLYDFQELATALAETVAPARLLRRLWDKLDDVRLRQMSAYSDALKRIDQMPAETVATYLPLYLGEAIATQIRKDRRPTILLIDSIETLGLKSHFRLTKERPDSWLRELIACTECGLWVLAGRERIRWADEQQEWESVLGQHALGPLTDEDADHFLSQIPVEDPEIRGEIVKSARGLPLYLDLSASTYITRKSEGEQISKDDFRLHEGQIIDRFLAHLERDEREAIRCLSYLSRFDRNLFNQVIQAFNIAIPLTLFDEFVRTSYVQQFEDSEQVFAIQKTVRDYLARPDEATQRTIFEICVGAAPKAGDGAVQHVDGFMARFSDATRNLKDIADDVNAPSLLAYLRLGLQLIEHGDWLRVRDEISGLTPLAGEFTLARRVAEFLEALALRRMGRIRDAVKVYRRASKISADFGDLEDLFQFYFTHARHLSGQYALARKQYQRLIDSGTAPDARFLARRQLCDVLFLQGRFRQAANGLEPLLKARQSQLSLAETKRFEGHIQRFNLRLSEAKDVYTEVQMIATAEGADMMLGKAATNLAETLCLIDPYESLRHANVALELNEDVWAPIEFGKALAAKAIACARLKDFRAARSAATQSLEIQVRNGYRSGEIFAMFARAFVFHCESDTTRLAQEARNLVTLTDKLGVYRFLAKFASVFSGDRVNLGADTEWLDDGIHMRFSDIFGTSANG